MELHAPDWLGGMSKTGHRVVIQVPVRHHTVRRRQRILIHTEAVILTGDFHPAGFKVSNGLIGPTVSERQLPGGRPQRQGQQLMPQANPECGYLAGNLTQCLDEPLHRRRIARAIGYEQAIGPKVSNGLR